MIQVQLIENPQGIADCPGFKSAGVAADIREKGDLQRLDLALVTAEQPCNAAGVFTLNDVCAAPVHVCKAILSQPNMKVAGFVANSGNANAATAEQGMRDAKEMSAIAQLETGIGSPFLVCSTGRIGRKLPMGKIKSGIAAAAHALSSETQASLDAADAILTSDTRRKCATARFTYQGQTLTVAGIAKGAGMIEPNMATMLAFLTTDLEVDNAALKDTLVQACNQTFNRISIDGDMSTNDTVLLLANGKSGLVPNDSPELLQAFREAVLQVCDALAEKIVGDGEKVTKLVELVVEGCQSEQDAEKVARAVGNSLLVKTSWYGSDPNWGRLADAAGYARVGLKEACFDIHYDDVPALIGGLPQDSNLAQWKAIVSKKRFRITLNLNQGSGSFRLLTSDLSEAYVDFNKSE
ncbi:bifunctional glutamate N-acetyltransferase/amino-acid acetyltransferase ArgJ [Coraliomargarita sp. SDUM461004]|uniref:Arginine biosynthesis bifunctional protein ArgJ n=1 Tax=Thalassobacterium sedimentorum TaxID=3041258 RepID=A0ABU1ALW9_9BACT|nr:bifunctional glutamate N-acetyltransferase/amino-acid acetyltransferase ArgJ [Coraliomargarita sp. SDUM461004]MDQ8195778.1 bifunctional glutamate N-acetyltransferase/amino-acid acetyltransferase ArgJ [Coraliomargarita sp. SDUM461004]